MWKQLFSFVIVWRIEKRLFKSYYKARICAARVAHACVARRAEVRYARHVRTYAAKIDKLPDCGQDVAIQSSHTS
jgi:hypothetical protein